jgi:hypothetical protein
MPPTLKNGVAVVDLVGVELVALDAGVLMGSCLFVDE